MSSTLDLQFLLQQVQTLLQESRTIRKEIREMRDLTVKTFEFAGRVERRQSEMRDDLELTIKMEIGGRIAGLQTAIEDTVGKLESKIDDLAERIDGAAPSPL